MNTTPFLSSMLAACLLTVTPTLASAAVEKLTNRDFEESSNGLATGWNREFRVHEETNRTSAGTLEVDAASPHSGAVSQKVTGLVGVDEVSEVYFRLHQTVVLVKGCFYEGSVWLRGEPGMLFQVTLADEVDQAWNPLTIAAHTVRLKNADWTRVQFRGWALNMKNIAPFHGLFEIRCFTPGTFSVDDASLLESPPSDIDVAVPGMIATPVNPFYFGMISHTGFSTGWPTTLSPGLNRLWDSSQRWQTVQPNAYLSLNNLPYDRPTTWRLDPLDKVSRAPAQNRSDISLTLGAPPSWAALNPSSNGAFGPGSNSPPATDAIWRNYVSGMAHRYNTEQSGDTGHGKIRFWEIWNEVNAGAFNNKYRDMNRMVGLAREAYPILKRADPNNVVLSPNFAGALGLAYLDRYLAAGGGAYADAIAVHYYPRNYGMERYKNLIRNLREVLSQYGLDNLPIWNTEFGFCDGPSCPENATIKGPTSRALIMNWAMGIGHADYYSYDSAEYGLSVAGSLDANGISYQETRKWLLGATLTTHKQRSDGVWVITLTRPHNYQGYIVWKDEGASVTFSIPPSWGVTRKRDIAGTISSLGGVTSLSVDESPVLLENQAPEAGGNHRPTVEIIVPVRDPNGRTLTFFGNQPMVIKAQASDDDGTVSRVEFYDGPTKLGETTAQPYIHSFYPIAGTYNLTARAYDNNGASHTSAPVAVKVVSPVLAYDFNETGSTAVAAPAARVQTALALRDGTSGTDLHAVAAGALGAGDNAFKSGSGGMASGNRNAWLPAGAATTDNLGNLNAFTVTGWLRTNNVSGNKLGDGAVLLMVGNSMIKVSSQIANSGRLDLNVNGSAGVNTPNDFIPEIGSWVFFAVSYDGTAATSNVRFYRATAAVPVDATAAVVRSLNAGALNPANNGDLLIGNSAAFTRAFGGDLDGIAIFPAVLDSLQLEIIRQHGGVVPVYVPLAVADTATMMEDGGSISIDVLANDTNFNPAPGTPLSVGLVTSEAARGTAYYNASTRKIVYTPTAGYFTEPGKLGNAIIYFTVTDGTTSSLSSATVTVTSTATAGNLVAAGGLTGVAIGSNVTGFSRVLSTGDWEVRGSGNGMVDATDEVYVESRSEFGDFQVTARAKSLAGFDGSARTGVMIRESNAEGARFVALSVTPAGKYELAYRSAVGAVPAVSEVGATAVSFASPDIYSYSNAWLRLVRIGETVLAETSSDGTNWSTAGSATLSGLVPKLQFGLFTRNSAASTAKARGVFSNASIVSQVDPPAPVIAYRFDEANGANGRNAVPTANAVVRTALALRLGVSPDDMLHGESTGHRGAGDNTFQSGNGAMANGDRNGYLAAGASTTGQLSGLAAFTVTGWLRTNNLAGNKLGGGAVLLTIGTPLIKVSSQLANSGRLDLEVNGTTSVNTPSDFVPEIGSWVFFAVTYDSAVATENVTFYRGTTSVAVTSSAPVKRTLNAGALGSANNGDLLIGNSPAFTRAFGGEINDLAIYPRALDIDEVENVRLKSFGP